MLTFQMMKTETLTTKPCLPYNAVSAEEQSVIIYLYTPHIDLRTRGENGGEQKNSKKTKKGGWKLSDRESNPGLPRL